MKVQGIKTFENHLFEMNFINEQRVYRDEKEAHVVSVIEGSVTTNNVLAFAGVNASGKTTSLMVIDYVLGVLFLGRSANFLKRIIQLMDDTVMITTVFSDKGYLYKTYSELQKSRTENAVQLEFENEVVLKRKIPMGISRNRLDEFDDENIFLRLERNELDESITQFLKKDDSIVSSQISKVSSGYVLDTFNQTDMNFLSSISDFSSEVVLYLDPTIEEFSLKVPRRIDKQSLSIDQIVFDLKLFGQPQIQVPFLELNQYLSSGTIRGLNLISMIADVLEEGGYLLVDELENHFNKSIVENLIEFFQSDVNKKGATLIFSTHYSELLDSVKRRDSIKVVRKKSNEINISSLNKLADEKGRNRSDIRNSDLFLSGIFGTAPSFDRYWNLNRYLKAAVEDSGYD